MNKNLQDLLPNPFAVDYQVSNGPLDLYTEKEMEQFAEQVIRRCAAIVSLYRRDNMQDKAIADTLEAVYQEMRLHFGVK